MLSSLVKISFVILNILTLGTKCFDMIGPGRWRVVALEPCEGEYQMRLEVCRHRINRTHDGFNVILAYDRDLDSKHAIRMDTCKYVDGGCKPYTTLADDDFTHFAHKFAGDNVRDLLDLAGVSPPDFPIPAGTMEATEFVFNYDELPEKSVYGSFAGKAYILFDGAEVGCFCIVAKFVENDDDDR